MIMEGNPTMLTLDEILEDVAESPAFQGLNNIGANTRGKNGETPLHWMATLGDAQGIRILVDAGAVVDAVDENGNTPLHESSASKQIAAAQMLIELGANQELKNHDNLTASDIAASEGFQPMIDLLKG